MIKIVIPDKRYPANTPKRWKVLADVSMKDVLPLETIPDQIISVWEKREQRPEYVRVYGYLNFKGLSPEMALKIIALAKAGKALVNVNRWGQVAFWSLKNNKEAR